MQYLDDNLNIHTVMWGQNVVPTLYYEKIMSIATYPMQLESVW